MEAFKADRRPLVNTEKAANYAGVTVRFLEQKRLDGLGPEYRKLSPRCVRYSLDDLDTWLDKCKRVSTVEG
jgi:hypothetical protein